MPEGPSIVILRELTEQFEGKKVLNALGNAKIDINRMQGLKLISCRSWGKHFLLVFNGFFVRVHFLMFGTYRINERKDAPPRLALEFSNGELNFYTCSVKLIDGNVNDVYDWEKDVMADEWNPKKAETELMKTKTTKVCDALLNQEIFAGVGNIIKNEVLWRICVHPESHVTALPAKKLKEMIRDARDYSFLFYAWKKEYVLKKNWKIYKKGECPRCEIKTIRTWLGINERLTCYCPNCQLLYLNPESKVKSAVKKKAKAVKKVKRTTKTASL
ncbi:MAG TPA: DNA-formamidopyrimidine glycosylase family protein [Bacteroidia bacterium]|nr:DNA-formamidopyrimidine glycosylase family protein [Bacteroidia bacterium]